MSPVLTNTCYFLFLFPAVVIQVDVRCCLTAVLICRSLMVSDAEHLLMALLAVCTSSLEKSLFKSFACF